MKKLPVIIGRAVSRRPAEGFASRVLRHPNAPGMALDIASRAADVGADFIRDRSRDIRVRTESAAFCAKMDATVRGIDSITRLAYALGDNGTEAHYDQLVGAAADMARPPEEGP